MRRVDPTVVLERVPPRGGIAIAARCGSVPRATETPAAARAAAEACTPSPSPNHAPLLALAWRENPGTLACVAAGTADHRHRHGHRGDAVRGVIAFGARLDPEQALGAVLAGLVFASSSRSRSGARRDLAARRQPLERRCARAADQLPRLRDSYLRPASLRQAERCTAFSPLRKYPELHAHARARCCG